MYTDLKEDYDELHARHARLRKAAGELLLECGPNITPSLGTIAKLQAALEEK